ncbi:MAG TPA: tetratricopeptide repeat protein [Cyclobacteriaceae bacterium]|nr:tetratricopeptide repeat protein [Cyclobacteriaceae bacterium]
MAKTCLTGSILFLSFFQTIAQDEETTSAEWYQNFFTRNSKQSAEQVLKLQEDRLLEALEMQDDSAQARILLESGLIHLTRTFNYDTAMEFFIRSLTISDSLDHPSGKIFSYLAISDVFEEVGNYEKSTQFLEKAFELSSVMPDPGIHILVLNEMGKMNSLTGNAEEALRNFEEVLSLEEKLNQPGLKADALFNIAKLHDKNGDQGRSIEFHKRALAIWRSIGNRLQEARLLNEIGGAYERMTNLDRALANYTAALEVYQIIDRKSGIAESYNNIGALYYQQKKIKEAIEILEKGLSAGRSSQTKDPVRRSYEYLSLCFEEQGDFKKALEYKESFIAMNEFIQKEESDQKLLEAQNRYVLDQKETQIERLDQVRMQREREIAEQRKVRNFLFALIGLGVVVAGLILYLYLVKRRSEKQLKVINARVEEQNIQLQSLNATKDKFFSILGHDLKSPLNSLSSFSNLLINYFDSLSKEEIQALAKDLDKSLKNLYSLLDNLLEWARSQTGNISFSPESFDLTTVLNENKDLLNTQAGNKQISIVLERTAPLTVLVHKHSITTVVRNLVSNAIKFTPAGGQIKINVLENKKDIVVSVADTGVGMSEAVIKNLFRIDSKHSTLGTANEKGTGLGLVLCKDFVEKNGGRLWVESKEGAGSVFYFTIPRSGEN